jgi:hypothetical protein
VKRLSLRLTVLAAAFAACIGSASAQTALVCSGPLNPGTYLSVTVPAGATCNLSVSGTVTVTNNVELEKGASLLHSTPALTFIVNGSLLARDASQIVLDGIPGQTTLNIIGSVHLTGITRSVGLGRVSIGGTLFITDSTVRFLDVFKSNVGGSVLVRDNNSPSLSSIVIADNGIGGSLVCSGNMPAPILFNLPPNTVGGNKVGQCSGL